MIKWKRKEGRFISPLQGKLNEAVIFNIYWDSFISREQVEKYKLVSELPGIKSHLGHYVDETTAKEKAENLFDRWLLKVGLKLA
jgi:hypothetical protein